MVQIDRYSSYITESLMLSNNFNTIKVSTNQKVSEPQAFTVGNGQNWTENTGEPMCKTALDVGLAAYICTGARWVYWFIRGGVSL